jgi:hypothetical protein
VHATDGTTVTRRPLALLLLASCLTAGSATAAARKPTDPKKRINPADQAWAAKIRIHHDDLGPGYWRVEASQDNSVAAPQGCKEPDLSDLIETGEAENPDFSRNGSFVGSGAAIFLTTQHATTAFQRVARQSFNRCMISAFKQGLAGSGARLRILSSGPVPMKSSVPHFASGRVRFSVAGPAATVTGRISFYFFAKGRALGMLLVASIGRPLQPIPESLERRLAALVATRLQHR